MLSRERLQQFKCYVLLRLVKLAGKIAIKFFAVGFENVDAKVTVAYR